MSDYILYTILYCLSSILLLLVSGGGGNFLLFYIGLIYLHYFDRLNCSLFSRSIHLFCKTYVNNEKCRHLFIPYDQQSKPQNDSVNCNLRRI